MRGTIYLCGIVVVLSSVLSLEARVVSSANNVFDTLWPFPQAATAEGEVPLLISEETLKFVPDVPDALSSRVDRLSSRYRDIILNTTCSPKKPGARDQPEHTVEPYVMPPVHLTVASDTMPLGPGTDESYTLSLSPENASISARTYTGLVHGLEIFSQLMICIPAGPPTKIFGDALVINATRISIEDFPRFTHRAIMIDTARHFLPVTHILKVLDAMSYAHFSVLHWHITDAQSFPLVLSSLPNLTRGAYTAQDVYTTADVHAIVTHAFDRGIRVIPEIDQPGHAASWEAGYPGLTVPECGTLNPAYPGLFSLLADMFRELGDMFPDSMFHIGCDEVPFQCWNTSDVVVRWMEQHGFARDELGLKAVAAHYITEAQHTLRQASNRTPIVWQEAFDHYGPSVANPTPPPKELDKETVVELWLDPTWDWANLTDVVSGAGYNGNHHWSTAYRAIVTLGWYLDDTAVNSWDRVYTHEPLSNATCNYTSGECTCTCSEGMWRDGQCHCYNITRPSDVARVLGGEAPVWGEHIDETNWFPRVFPRALAVAERLWSHRTLNDPALAEPRLHATRCRFLRRGIMVTPLGPGFC
eukprot:m.759499 g.759499  ORF g.759499 m.759499 type:complete len:586 (+) comp23196_c1_seq12:107-1864(+)